MKSEQEFTEALTKSACEKHGITPDDLLRRHPRRKSRPYCLAREEIALKLRTQTNLSYPQIGRLMGDLHHTTVLHLVRSAFARQSDLV